MSRRMWILTAAALVPVVAVGCASMQKVKPEEAIDARQKLMKGQGEAWKAIQEKTKAGDVAAVVPEAEKLVQTSKEIPRLFPEGSLNPEKSAAKPEIWAKWPDFEAAAKNLQTQAEKLRDTAKTGNTAATQQVVSTFGRQACGTCHTPFRVPPKQS
jgi:cytochrome c556